MVDGVSPANDCVTGQKERGAGSDYFEGKNRPFPGSKYYGIIITIDGECEQ